MLNIGPNILKPLEKSKSEILPNEASKSNKVMMEIQGIEVVTNNNCSGDNMENSQPNNNLSVKNNSSSILQKRESGNSKHKILRADFEVIW